MLYRFILPGAIASGLVLANGCATSPLPSTMPQGSPASSEAQPASVSSVTLALESDPPLPGDPVGGWTGLDESTTPSESSASPAHHDHGGHHAH